MPVSTPLNYHKQKKIPPAISHVCISPRRQNPASVHLHFILFKLRSPSYTLQHLSKAASSLDIGHSGTQAVHKKSMHFSQSAVLNHLPLPASDMCAHSSFLCDIINSVAHFYSCMFIRSVHLHTICMQLSYHQKINHLIRQAPLDLLSIPATNLFGRFSHSPHILHSGLHLCISLHGQQAHRHPSARGTSTTNTTRRVS